MVPLIAFLIWLPVVALVLGRFAIELLWRRTVGYRVWVSYRETERAPWRARLRELRRESASLDSAEGLPTAYLMARQTHLSVIRLCNAIVMTVVVSSLLLLAGAFWVINVIGIAIAILAAEIVASVRYRRIFASIERILVLRRGGDPQGASQSSSIEWS
ncbi:hypothetical protein [Ferrimicrobium sp.]|uniref:hypothetical protein n=1 Tax=Ferrimicrobium sp. TaxID=2926050 RepID=UPI002608D270|nr:hypothetical protein [Ferrimicrobium sp.]